MNDHYKGPTNNELRDEDLINPVEDERKEPLTFVYDPARVPTLTAQELKRIEDDVYRQGISANEGQSIIYDELERMGLKYGDMQRGDTVVFDFVDVDGKHDLRPVKVSYEDFGTHVQGAQLDNIGEDNNKEEAEQQRMLRTVLEDIGDDIQRASDKIEEESDILRRGRVIVDEALSQIDAFALRLKNGQHAQQDEIKHLTEQEDISQMRALITLEADDSSEGLKVVTSLGLDVDERRRQNPNVDEHHQEVLNDSINDVKYVIEDMHLNRSRLAGETSEAQKIVEQILSIFNELLYSNQRGHEAYGARLSQLVNQLGEIVKSNRTLSDEFPGLVSKAIGLTRS